jgi:hypothetical protein
VFAFHRPETLAAWLKDLPAKVGEKGWESTAVVHTGSTTPGTANEASLGFAMNSEAANAGAAGAATFLGHMQFMPPSKGDGLLRPALAA